MAAVGMAVAGIAVAGIAAAGIVAPWVVVGAAWEPGVEEVVVPGPA
jgi:hypothetical protein